MNKQVDQDRPSLTYWINASKICLNVGKTEYVFFSLVLEQTDTLLKLKFKGKCRTLHTQRIPSRKKWWKPKLKTQYGDLDIKLNRANIALHATSIKYLRR